MNDLIILTFDEKEKVDQARKYIHELETTMTQTSVTATDIDQLRRTVTPIINANGVDRNGLTA